MGSYEKCQPGFRDDKRPKILGTKSGAKFEKQSKHGQIQENLTFGLITASVTLKDVSLQLNGMLTMWKIQQAMQDDAIQTARIHPAVHPGNRDEVLIWQNFQPAYRDLGWKTRERESSQSALSYEHIEHFTKDLEVRRDLGNRASTVNRDQCEVACEQALH